MRVRAEGAIGKSRDVTSGVPQGSVLGPLLFLIYINHAVSDVACNHKFFADDIKFYLTLSAAASSVPLQSDIDKLVLSSSSWGLTLNPSKCVVLCFAS